MMTQLRAITAKYNDYVAPAYTPPAPPVSPARTPVEPPPSRQSPPEIDRTPWRQLKLGLSRDQVKSLLGEPATVSVFGENYENWYYDKDQKWKSKVVFNKKGVSSWIEP
jgi:hypothetical protein